MKKNDELIKNLAMWYKENHGKHVVLTVEQQIKFKNLIKQGLEYYLDMEVTFDKNNLDIFSLTTTVEETSVSINLSSGLCLTTKGKNSDKINSAFALTISRILDEPYDFKYKVYQEQNKKRTCYFVSEWHFLPRERLEELLPHLDTNNPIFVADFNDCETPTIIEDAKGELLSSETYIRLFGTQTPSALYEEYIVRQILNKRPDILKEQVYDWFKESKGKTRELMKGTGKKKGVQQ